MTPRQQEQLRQFAGLLADAPFNLLSRRDRDHVWERHVGESLRIWEAVGPRPAERWLDLGTGGGLPGLVLAVMSPEAHFTLVDARGKKIAAVAHFAGALRLENVTAVAGRAEALARQDGMRGSFDAVISRALGKLPTVVELSRGFLRPGGLGIAVRGGQVERELAEMPPEVLEALAVRDLESEAVSGTSRVTWLVRMRAAGAPPRGVPRDDGIPAARPLGAQVGDPR